MKHTKQIQAEFAKIAQVVDTGQNVVVDSGETVAVSPEEIPCVIVKTRMIPQKYHVCPRCMQEIHEKGYYYDGTNWFHRACQEKGPIKLGQ